MYIQIQPPFDEYVKGLIPSHGKLSSRRIGVSCAIIRIM